MRSAWRVADIRAAEETLMAALPEGVLMSRAAAGLARRCAMLMRTSRGGVYGGHVTILAGTGNNGGDALYAGAILAGRGARVRALTTDPVRAHAGGRKALEASGGVVIPGALVDDLPRYADLVIDGLLGIGGRGGLREPAAQLALAAEALTTRRGRPATVVAVDVPSGVDADTGAAGPNAVRADVTVTFGAYKPGLVVGDGAVHSGLLDLVDIGLLDQLESRTPRVLIPDQADIAAWWPRPRPSDDKYSRGVVGVATGSATYPGAGVLSVLGALAGPVGMVRYAGAAAGPVLSRCPTVVATERVELAGRALAWVCGCGVGTDQRAESQLRAVLAAGVPVCLDADALTLLARDPSIMDGHVAGAVVTPHDREFQRLAGVEPGADRVGAARELAVRLGVVVLLKGHATIVATPGDETYVNPTGTAELASAGTGDVLAGLIGSLLASGLTPERAAVAGAYVHGLAGRYAARSGQLTAENLARRAREVMAVGQRGEERAC